MKLPLKDYLKHVYRILLLYYRFLLQKRMVGRKKYIACIKKYFSENLDKIEYQMLIPKRKIEFNEIDKKFLDEDIYCNILIKKNKDQGYIQPEIFLCKFKNIKFFGHSGVVSYKNKPLLDTARTVARLRNWSFSVDSIFLRHRKMKGVYTSLMHIVNYVFYHILLENLPRCYGIYKINEPEINVIIPWYIPKYQIELFKIFLDRRFKFIRIKPNEVWEIETFYFSSFWHIDCSAYIPKELIEFVRNKVFSYYGIKSDIKERKRRLFLSRAKVNSRHILNYRELVDLLNKYGFEELHPQDLPFKRQVEIFNEAEIVIGSEGSAFTNIIFGTNLKVIIIFPPSIIQTHYLLFCKAMGHTFKYIVGYDGRKNIDCKVDLREVEIILKELIA